MVLLFECDTVSWAVSNLVINVQKLFINYGHLNNIVTKSRKQIFRVWLYPTYAQVGGSGLLKVSLFGLETKGIRTVDREKRFREVQIQQNTLSLSFFTFPLSTYRGSKRR